MVLITIVTGAYKPTYNWGASHCMEHHHFSMGRSPISTGPFSIAMQQITRGSWIRIRNHGSYYNWDAHPRNHGFNMI